MIAPKEQEFCDKSTGEVYTLKTKRGKSIKSISPQDARSLARAARFKLQNAAASVLTGERVCKCCRVNIDSSVKVMRSQFETGAACHYKGLMFCGSVWTCSVCGAKIREKRSHELREAFEAANQQNIHVSHITFTFPHSREDNLKLILDQFLTAFKKFWDSAPMRKFKDQYGCIGRVRALETTYSDANGFHPHIHLLYFTKVKLSDIGKIQNLFLKVWNDKLKRSGLPEANRRGISIQNGDKAGEYINKFGEDSKLVKTKSGDDVTWDMADEITKLNVKSGRAKSLTPFDFLRVIDSPDSYGYSEKDLPRFRALFKEYAEAFKGKSQLEWGRMSMDLRANLGLKAVSTDEEILNEDEAEAVKVIALPRTIFTRLLPKKSNNYRDLRSVFLTVCETKSDKDIKDFLYTSCCTDVDRAVFDRLLLSKVGTDVDCSKDDYITTFESRTVNESQFYNQWLLKNTI